MYLFDRNVDFFGILISWARNHALRILLSYKIMD